MTVKGSKLSLAFQTLDAFERAGTPIQLAKSRKRFLNPDARNSPVGVEHWTFLFSNSDMILLLLARGW